MKVIIGMFSLDENVKDLKAYEEPKRNVIELLLKFGDKNDIAMRFGTLDDDTYACEYEVRGKTNAYCKGMVSELKSMLKEQWKGIDLVYEKRGETIGD